MSYFATGTDQDKSILLTLYFVMFDFSEHYNLQGCGLVIDVLFTTTGIGTAFFSFFL